MRSQSKWTNKNILIFGLGKFSGGVSSARYFANQNANVLIVDEKDEEYLTESIFKLKDSKNIKYSLGGCDENLLDKIDLAVINPAVPPSHPFLKKIEQKQIETTSEINLVFNQCQGKIITVTGTNGKGTVFSLLRDILPSKNKLYSGGNIGESLLPVIDQIKKEDWVLLEISSFQSHWLKKINKRPDIIVYTNICEDHLDWHQNLDNYLEDKLSLVDAKAKESFCLANVDDELTSQNLNKIKAKLMLYGTNSKADVYLENGKIYFGLANKKLLASKTINAPGDHNKSNSLAVAGVCYLLGIDSRIVDEAFENFQPLADTLEFIGTKNGVNFYNDSESTNPQATIVGVKALSGKTWLIAGGFDKGINYRQMADETKNNLAGVASIGQITDELAQTYENIHHNLKIFKANDLLTAFKWCAKNAQSGENILLSPATSSYDQFSNLQERGRQFKKFVEEEI